MAAETKSRTTVPKVHTEQAKMAAMVAQMHFDQQQAQMKAQADLAKARMKAQTTLAGFAGQRLDEQAQAKADGEAANNQPMEIQAAPLPDASQPSANMAGGQGIDFNSLITPQGVQGGGAIQAATGGMGRAQPRGPDPAQLQGAVNPYNVSQSTVNRTVPVQYGGTPDNPYGGTSMVPQTATETTITPNQLTPYELGQLQEAKQRTEVQRFSTQFKAEGDIAKDLAGTLYGVQKGYLNPTDLDAARQAARDTLTQMGYSPERAAAVEARAQTMYGRYASEKTDSSSTEFMKTLHLRDQQNVGSPQWAELNDRLRKLTNTDSLSSSQRHYWDNMLKGPVIELQEKNQRQTQTLNLLNKINDKTYTNPESFGASGSLQRGVTAIGGAVKSLANLLPAREQATLVTEATGYLPQMMQDSIGPDGKIDEESATILKELQNSLYAPANVGTLTQLESALRIMYAGAYFKTLNVRAVETVMKDKIKLVGARDVEEVRASLAASIAEIQEMKSNTELHMKSSGIPVLPYQSYTPSIFRGTAPAPSPNLPTFAPTPR